MAKKKLESEEVQNDCNSIVEFLETAEMDQAESVITDIIYENIGPFSQERKHSARKDEGYLCGMLTEKGRGN